MSRQAISRKICTFKQSVILFYSVHTPNIWNTTKWTILNQTILLALQNSAFLLIYCSSVDFVTPPASQPPADGLWGVTPPEPSILPTVLASTLIPNIYTYTQCSYFSVCPPVLPSHRLGSRVTPCHSVPSWAFSDAVLRPLASPGWLMCLWSHFWPCLCHAEGSWQALALATICSI